MKRLPGRALTTPSSASLPVTSPSTVQSPSRSSAPTLDVGRLEGKILFTRAGGKFGDETVFTANADGSDEQRITDHGVTCCPRWTPDGAYILISALSDNDRITTQFIEPDGTPVRQMVQGLLGRRYSRVELG